MDSPANALQQLLAVLDKMELPYYVGGSVASSVHGVPRLTMDVDVVVNLREDRVDELAALLASEFYADARTIRNALAVGRAFNVIHLQSAYKIDLFPLRKDAFSRSEFARRKFTEIRSLGEEPIECAVASAEDTVLRKLAGYRAGGETSERQWNDLLGVVRVSGAKLDREYMRHWADYLKVGDLLERLLSERLES
jgi:hypothetical protein